MAIHRGELRGEFGSWAFSVREPIPPIAIPLDADVSDVALNLRMCMDRVYDLGRYDDQLDYRKAPEFPLGKSDAKWARELLATRKTA